MAVSAIEALHIIDKEGLQLGQQLKENVTLFRQTALKNSFGFELKASNESPVMHIRLIQRILAREEEEKLLQEVVDIALRDGFLISRAKYCLSQELKSAAPSIRVVLSAGMAKKDVEKIAAIIRDAFKRVIKK